MNVRQHFVLLICICIDFYIAYRCINLIRIFLYLYRDVNELSYVDILLYDKLDLLWYSLYMFHNFSSLIFYIILFFTQLLCHNISHNILTLWTDLHKIALCILSFDICWISDMTCRFSESDNSVRANRFFLQLKIIATPSLSTSFWNYWPFIVECRIRKALKLASSKRRFHGNYSHCIMHFESLLDAIFTAVAHAFNYKLYVSFTLVREKACLFTMNRATMCMCGRRDDPGSVFRIYLHDSF